MAGAQAYWWLIRAYLSGAPYITTKFRSRKLVRAVRRLAERNHYDCTILDHSQLGWMLQYPFLPRPVLFSAHNFESGLYADQAADRVRNGVLKRRILARDARLVRSLETKLVSECRQTWVLTAAERDAFGALVPDASGRIHVFDLPGKRLQTGSGPGKADIDVGILGSWLWEVNRRGLDWFMESVVPLLPTSMRIHIAGRGAESVPNRHSNVVYEGFVDSSAEFLRRCKVIVVPTVARCRCAVEDHRGYCRRRADGGHPNRHAGYQRRPGLCVGRGRCRANGAAHP